MSLRKKMLYIFSTLSCCCLLVAMVICGVETYRTTKRMNAEELVQSIELYSERTNTWFKSASSILDSLAIYMEQQTNSGINESSVRAYNEELTKSYSFAHDIYTTDADGNFYDGTGWIPDADWNCKTREWYISATEQQKTVYGSPYVDVITGNLITYISRPYFVNGKICGTATMDITLDGLSDLINGFYDTSEYVHFMLTDPNGNIIIHESSSFNPTKDSILNIKDVLDGGYEAYANTGKSMKDYDGSSVYAVSSPIGETGWTIYLMEDSSVFLSDLKRLVLIFIIIMFAAQGIIITVTYLVSKSIVDRIDIAKDAALKMADGDFSFEIKSTSKDELGQLADGVKLLCNNTNDVISDLGHILGGMEAGDLTTLSKDADMYKGDYFKLITSIRNFREKITATLKNINDASNQVLSGSEQVSSDAQGLSHGAAEQSSSIQELSATIHDVTDKVNANADSAEQAMNKTNETQGKLNLANEKMNNLIAAMSETKECSDQIGKIIKSIEDIAFQTNILALNAAVEAARAGAAGKGFAVVADEVRNLAGKSAEAAANTNTLIENTIMSVERGDKLVNEVADVMLQVAEASQQVAEFNTNICDSSAALADSIAQINSGIDQISGVVQNNAATAEQSAAASEELSGQANTLKNLVDEFTLE